MSARSRCVLLFCASTTLVTARIAFAQVEQVAVVLVARAGSAGNDRCRAVDVTTRTHGVVKRPALAPAIDAPATWSSGVIDASRPFRDVLVSWNVDAPEGTGFVVEIAVAPTRAAALGPSMTMGEFGFVPKRARVLETPGGKIDTDFFRGERTFERAELRIVAFRAPDAKSSDIVLRRIDVCFSDKTRVVDAPPRTTPVAARTLDVPFRSQKTERPEIAGRICSPTSLSMVLAFRGVDRPTGEVAARAYDAHNDIYGNWPRNIQAAWTFGVPGYLTRFATWTAVEDEIARGNPLVLSIGVKKGQLTGAPYESTAGHLIVLVGFDEKGDCIVNDPAVSEPKLGRRTYARSEMDVVWRERGGTAYVLLAQE